MKTLTEIMRDLRLLQQAQQSGSPAKLRITWKKVKDTRTLASILEQLANRNEAKVK